MTTLESVPLRQLRQNLGKWVDRAVFTQRPIAITNNSKHVADIVPLPGADHPATPGSLDAAQGVVQSTLRAAKKLSKKLSKNSGKKAGKRVSGRPRRPATPPAGPSNQS